MKKIILVLTLAALMTVSACKNETKDVNNIPETVKTIEQIENIDLNGLNEYKSIKNASLEETSGIKSIVLYTDVDEDENGNFLWDDGQNYALVAEDSDGYLSLFPKHIFSFAILIFLILKNLMKRSIVFW